MANAEWLSTEESTLGCNGLKLRFLPWDSAAFLHKGEVAKIVFPKESCPLHVLRPSFQHTMTRHFYDKRIVRVHFPVTSQYSTAAHRVSSPIFAYSSVVVICPFQRESSRRDVSPSL